MALIQKKNGSRFVRKRPMTMLLPVALVASAAMLTACINTAAMHPADVLQKVARNSSVLIFSTSSKQQSFGFALAISLYHIQDNGALGPIPGERYAAAYYLGHPLTSADITSADVNLDWRALQPGRYVFLVEPFNPHECIAAAPEYYLSIAPGQVLYLGEFHRDGHALELQRNYSRDVGYFRAHAVGAKDAKVLPATVDIKNVDYRNNSKFSCRSLFQVELADPHGTPRAGSSTASR